MAQDQHLLWTTKGTQAALQDQDYLDPYSLYDFFSTANAARVHRGRHGARVKSATPRIGGRNPSSIRSGLTIDTSLRNPSPTPATSRPLSARSGKSAFSSTPPSIKVNAPSFTQSPTSLYLGFQKARCKSAPPRPVGYYLPRRPKTAKSQASTSGVSSVRSAPKRAWQNRTSSTKDCHSLLSPEEVNQRHNERCKSAPVPYDFSSIEIVTSVSEQSSDIQRLRALTRPLNCMPEVVKNVLSSNALRHCCSAYHPRPKTSPSTRRQFWPVTRPAVFHRGDVPKYLHFVKPAGYWTRGNADYQQTPASDDGLTRTGDSNAYNVPDLMRTGDSNAYNVSAETNLSMHGSDIMQETVLYEEQFLVSATLSEASLSDQENWPEFEVDGELQADEDLDAIPSGDLAPVANKFLGDKEGEEEISPEETRPVPRLPEELQSDNKITQPEEHGFQITITKADPLPVQDPVDQADQLTVQDPTPDYEVTQQEEIESRDDHKETAETDAGFGIVVSEMPQGIGAQSGNETDEEHNSEVLSQEELKPEPSPEPVLEEPSAPANDHDPVEEDEQKQSTETPRVSSEPELKSQVSQVKFSESLILTSFKSPEPREEKKELPVKPILKPTVTKQEVLPPVSEKPKLLQKEVSKEKVPATPLPKPQAKIQDEEAKPHKDLEEKKQVHVQEEKKEESPKLEAKVLPQPEFIRAPGAYKMYDPKDLLQFKVEQHRDTRADKKSLSAPPMPHFVPSAESTVVMTSILDDQKRVKEGMKPWLQGRLALSRQTSRFELPMDVRLLEAMTPMEYLTKYCIISTRRKALYKHIFQKVDRDRDNLITFKEMDKGLKDIHVDYINTEQVKKLIEMVESNEKSTFNLAQFSAIAAFSERLLFSESQVSERNSVYSSKEIIEEADFCGLKFKLSGFLVNPTVRKILEVL